jgi:hypothetical protein
MSTNSYFATANNQNPSPVVTAKNIGLRQFGCAVVDNIGPSAVQIFSGGSPSGLVLETIGAGQRKTVILGGAPQACIALALGANGDLVGDSAPCSILFDDDYSLSGVPAKRTGNSLLAIGAGPAEKISALMYGMDRIRGIALSGADSSQFVSLLGDQNPNSTLAFVQPTSRDMILDVNLSQLICGSSPAAMMLSDSPFGEGQSSPGATPYPPGTTWVDVAIAGGNNYSPAKTFYLCALTMNNQSGATATHYLNKNNATTIAYKSLLTGDGWQLTFGIPIQILSTDAIEFGAPGASFAGLHGYE